MAPLNQQQYALKGSTFGARGCACSCDPCDCDPCTCGDASSPTWRVCGYYVTAGVIHGVDVSQLLVLSLAQPSDEESQGEWREVILVDSTATAEQNTALVKVFEKRFDSIPAEVGFPRKMRRTVYSVPMSYDSDGESLTISMTVSPATVSPLEVNADDDSTLLREWAYTGPLVLRERFELHAA